MTYAEWCKLYLHPLAPWKIVKFLLLGQEIFGAITEEDNGYGYMTVQFRDNGLVSIFAPKENFTPVTLEEIGWYNKEETE